MFYASSLIIIDMKNTKPDIKDLFREKLLAALRERDVPDRGRGAWLAKEMEVTPKAVSKWLNGESMPERTKLDKLATVLKKKWNYFYLGMEVGESIVDAINAVHSEDQNKACEPNNQQYQLDRCVNIPQYNIKLSAGNGYTPTEHESCKMQAFPKDWLNTLSGRTDSLVITQAHGDSMQPRIYDNDYLIIDTSQREIQSGKIYAIRVNDELRVKRLIMKVNGNLMVISDNPYKKEFPDEELSPPEQRGMNIIGRIVWVGGAV